MTTAPRPQLREIPIGLIDEPELPSRTSMDEDLMNELVASMRSIGFVSVLVVVIVGERYRVVAGHRRRLAAGRAGIVAVPCLVYPSEYEALDAIQHAENRHREALSAADEAVWFQELLELHPAGGTDGVAARVGETRGYVEGRLLLFQGCQEVFGALADGRINIGVAQQLNRCEALEYRRLLLDNAIRNGATVGQVKQWISEWEHVMRPALRDVLAAPPAAAPPPRPQNDFFTCLACEQSDNAPHMRPVNVHDYCIDAQLKPALAMWGRRHDYTRAPRTLDEARALVSDLLDRFPDLISQDSATA